jgi:hypothetical protein
MVEHERTKIQAADGLSETISVRLELHFNEIDLRAVERGDRGGD